MGPLRHYIVPFVTLTSLTSPDDVAMLHTTRNVVAIARLKHLMTESFTIPKLPTSDSVSSVASWVMSWHCSALSRLWILFLSFLLDSHLQLVSERDVIVLL